MNENKGLTDNLRRCAEREIPPHPDLLLAVCDYVAELEALAAERLETIGRVTVQVLRSKGNANGHE